MNRKTAYQILELDEDIDYTDADIKKQYRSKILQYHPDKNTSANAAEKFIEVQDAYKFLHSNASDEYKDASYKDVFHSFLSSILREETNVPLLRSIIEMICKKICLIIDNNVEAIIDYLQNINKDTLKIVYAILSKYRHILHFSEELVNKIEELLDMNECIVLNPTLNDLMSEENIYILKNEGKSYLVPLWHHEIVFDCSSVNLAERKKMVVRVFPLLPDNISLDDYNKLTVHLQYRINDVWDRDVFVDIGGIPFVINGKHLRLTNSPQIIEYYECGVPYNNIEDIFDNSVRQSVVFIIRILI